jgi:hypothetical protein
MVTSGNLAVYDAPDKPFEVRTFPIREPRGGEVLVKIRMSTICRSDIHSGDKDLLSVEWRGLRWTRALRPGLVRCEGKEKMRVEFCS